jgi:predicted transcriptional regulator
METVKIWESDYRFMKIVWDLAPIASGRLVELCREQLDWKKSTTYNAIRRLSEQGLIRNDKAIVSVVMAREQVQRQESQAFLDRTFAGSLPLFLTAFLDGRPLSEREAEEIKRLIDAHLEQHGRT